MVGIPVLFLESPMQIAVVLLIALLVFGPKKLPEIGKQLGSALRELRKATHEITHSFTSNYDPEPEPYTDYTRAYGTVDYGYRAPDYTAPPDLTDYTIAGLPPNDQSSEPVAREAEDPYAVPSALAGGGADDAAEAGAGQAARSDSVQSGAGA